MKLIKNYTDLSSPGNWAILFLRAVFALSLFFGHGMGKIPRLFGEGPIKFLDFMGMGPAVSLALATSAEVLGSLLILAGLWTRLASIPVIFTLGVAAFVVHGDDGFSGQEKLFLYIAGFIVIMITGPGKYSLDHKLYKK